MDSCRLRFVAILCAVFVGFPTLTSATATTSSVMYEHCSSCTGSSSTIETLTKESQITCAMECKRTTPCQAISFSNTKQCTLFSGLDPLASSATIASYKKM